MKTLLHVLNAAVFLVIGVYFLFWVDKGAAVLGISFPKSQGLTDFRATYAGMCLGIGGFFFWAVLFSQYQRAASWLGVFLYAGLGLVRLYGIVIDLSGGSFLYSLLATEAILAALCAIALLR